MQIAALSYEVVGQLLEGSTCLSRKGGHQTHFMLSGAELDEGFSQLPILEDDVPADGAFDNSELLSGETLSAAFADLPQKKRKINQGKLPSGIAHRSAGHAAWMRLRRREKRASSVADGVRALAGAWDHAHGLRVGDQVNLTPGKRRRRLHPNTWTHRGVLRIAWRQVGRRYSLAKGKQPVGKSRRTLDCLVLLSSVAMRLAREQLQQWLQHLPCKNTLHIERHHDATPLLLTYGRFQGHVYPSAHYLHRTPDGKWLKLTYNELQQQFGSQKRKFDKGVLEFFAQTLTFHTANAETAEPEAKVAVLMPCILSSANANVTAAAVDFHTPEFTMRSLEDTALTRDLVTLSELPDNNNVNRRKRLLTAKGLPANVLYTPGGCAAHLLQRGLSMTMREADIVGIAHAIWFLTRHPQYKVPTTIVHHHLFRKPKKMATFELHLCFCRVFSVAKAARNLV